MQHMVNAATSAGGYGTRVGVAGVFDSIQSILLAPLLAAVVIFLIYILYAVLSGNANPSTLFVGSDRRFSTSKFQWWLWLWVLAYTYIAIYIARSIALGRPDGPVTDIPANVLSILGISTLTVTLAKGVTSSYAGQGAITKSDSPTGPKAQNLVSDDSDKPDLAKLQNFVWTLIAVMVYFAALWGILAQAAAAATFQAAHGLLTFPDLDSSLMVLSGLSASGYIGSKLVTRDAPKISSVTPTSGPAGQELTLIVLGDNFGGEKVTSGAGQVGSMLNIGTYLDHPTTFWSNGEIRATVPAGWAKGTYKISVMVGSAKSNEVAFTLE